MHIYECIFEIYLIIFRISIGPSAYIPTSIPGTPELLDVPCFSKIVEMNKKNSSRMELRRARMVLLLVNKLRLRACLFNTGLKLQSMRCCSLSTIVFCIILYIIVFSLCWFLPCLRKTCKGINNYLFHIHVYETWGKMLLSFREV